MAPYSFITLSYSQDPITETLAAGINNNGQIAGYIGSLGSSFEFYGLAAATAPSPILVATKLIRSLSTTPA